MSQSSSHAPTHAHPAPRRVSIDRKATTPEFDHPVAGSLGLTGQVKWFDPKKGYGFIVGPKGEDVFVHYSQITGDGFKSLTDGESVAYAMEKTGKGLLATTVTRIGDAPTA